MSSGTSCALAPLARQIIGSLVSHQTHKKSDKARCHYRTWQTPASLTGLFPNQTSGLGQLKATGGDPICPFIEFILYLCTIPIFTAPLTICESIQNGCSIVCWLSKVCCCRALCPQTSVFDLLRDLLIVTKNTNMSRTTTDGLPSHIQ